MVGDHVDDAAAGFAGEEPAHSTGFVGHRIDDLVSAGLQSVVRCVDVIDLDADVGSDRGGRVVGQNADLSGRCAWCDVGGDPAQVHPDLETHPFDPERAGRIGVRSRQVGHGAANAHDPNDTGVDRSGWPVRLGRVAMSQERTPGSRERGRTSRGHDLVSRRSGQGPETRPRPCRTTAPTRWGGERRPKPLPAQQAA